MKDEVIKRPVTSKDQAYQKNNLIESRLQYMTLREQKIMLMAFSRVKKVDEYGQTYSIKADDILDMLKLSPDEHRSLKTIADSLLSKKVEAEDENGWRIYPLFSMISYENKTRDVMFRFDKDITDMIKGLKEEFTTLQLSEIIGAKCAFSVKIFQLLKQYYPKISVREFDLEELKLKLGVAEKYKGRFNNFKRCVLDAAQKDMDQNASLTFRYKENRVGKKVLGVTFDIIDNKQAIIRKFHDEQVKIDNKQLLPCFKLIQQMGSCGITEKVAYSLIDQVGEDAMEQIIEEAMELNANEIIPVGKVAGTIVNMVKSLVVQRSQESLALVEEANQEALITENKQWFDANRERIGKDHNWYVDNRFVSMTLFKNDHKNEKVCSKTLFTDDDFISKNEELLRKYGTN